MSLTALLRDKGARAAIDTLLTNVGERPSLELQVPPASRNHAVVGIAFDYAVRFELARQFGGEQRPWIAERVADLVGPISSSRADGMTDRSEGNPVSTVDRSTARRWIQVVQQARKAEKRYSSTGTPSKAQRNAMVRHALRLARLDPFYRAGYVDERAGEVDPSDVADIVCLLDLVPWKDIGSGTPLLLNPDFGPASTAVGGADADIIAGRRLVEMKAVTRVRPLDDLRQLAGYLLLARAAQLNDPSYPEIREVAIYYARHGFLWVLPTERFGENPKLDTASRTFFRRARALSGLRGAA